MNFPLHSPKGTLPCRVEGHSGEHWYFPGHDIAKEWLGRRDLTRLEVEIGLATGIALKLKVDTSNIDKLRDRDLPDWQPDYFKDRPKLSQYQVTGQDNSEQPPETSAGDRPETDSGDPFCA